jgi:hypothetical protein
MSRDKLPTTFTLILVTGIALILSSCGSKSDNLASANLYDKSWLTGIPCAAPCWQSLEIGKSSDTEVRSTFSTLSFINQNTIQYVPQTVVSGMTIDRIYPGLLIRANCVRPSQPCLELTIAENILTRIDIQLNYKISVGEIIAELGPPDYVGYQLMGTENETCQVELVWHGKQLVMNSAPDPVDSSFTKERCDIVRDTGKPPANLNISGVSYMSIPWVDSMLVKGGSEFFKYSGTVRQP